jgi:release factor glutamine methyltransferase
MTTGAEAESAVFTVRDAITRGAEYLQGRGSQTARLDTELLVGEALSMDRLGLYLNLDRPLEPGERERARSLVMRRGRMEPVAHILGRREFYGHDFEVTSATLVPRPETEFLVDSALEMMTALDRVEQGDSEDGAEPEDGGDQDIAPGVRSPAAVVASPRRVLEVGAGSGCIAVSLALARPNLTVVATELSPEAAEVARRNAERHVVADRVTVLVQSDLAGLEKFVSERGREGGFDGLVSNPPYIAEGERGTLPPDVRDWEPETALFSGADGLGCIRWLLTAAPMLLKPGGFGVLEIGHDQADRVRELAERAGWICGGFRRDYGGHDRIALLQWGGHL